jgi:hypothetical protein
MARRGKARLGAARRGTAWLGTAGLGEARRGRAWPGTARLGAAGRGWAGRGRAWRGWAWPGSSGFSTHKTLSCSVLESHDNFVFDPKLAENTRLNSNVHDQTVDHPKSEFAQFAELLTQSHQDAVNPAHDAIDAMHPTATLSAQQAHHFLV